MFFTINNNRKYLNSDQLRTDIFLDAYFIIRNYPLKATDTLLDQFLQQQYDITLKNLCIKLILNLTFHEDAFGNYILIFKDPEYDKLARLITYGNGTVPGSRILQIALK